VALSPSVPVSVDLPARRVLVVCTGLALAVPLLLVAGVLRLEVGPGLVEQLLGTLALSGLALGWSGPVGVWVGLRLARRRTPWVQGLLGTLLDLPTVSLATAVAVLGGGPGLAGLAVGLVVLPQVALGTAKALERLDPELFRTADALGIPRARAAVRLGLPRVRGPVAAALVRGWGRGVGEALVTSTLLGTGTLSGAVLLEPGSSAGAAALLLGVALGAPLLAGRLEAR